MDAKSDDVVSPTTAKPVLKKEGYDAAVYQDWESGNIMHKVIPTSSKDFPDTKMGKLFLDKFTRLIALRDSFRECDWWMYEQAIKHRGYERLNMHYLTIPMHDYQCCFPECGLEMGRFHTFLTQGEVTYQVLESRVHFILHHGIAPSEEFAQFINDFRLEDVKLPPVLNSSQALKQPTEEDVAKMELLAKFARQLS
jgi:hypothetical protein